MNLPGLVLFIALLVAVEFTVFSWASHEKPENKDDDLNAKDIRQQEAHDRSVVGTPQQCIVPFSVKGKAPKFPTGNTVAICQRVVPESTVAAEFGTLFDNGLGIPRYSIYALEPVDVAKIGAVGRKDNWHQTAGITLQGSNKMYSNQPGPVKYQKGHVAPFNILSYSAGSGLASFAYTNAVPQVDKNNMSPWRKYEGRIVKYAQKFCAPLPKSGTLYLITGISEGHLQVVGGAVQAAKQPMVLFPNVPSIPQNIAIPNSMWTVGCCVTAGKALGAVAVIGNNLLPASALMQTNLGITKVEELIRVGAGLLANDPTITLFPGNAGCYDPTIQYDLSIKLP